jgi:hypothetical protein
LVPKNVGVKKNGVNQSNRPKRKEKKNLKQKKKKKMPKGNKLMTRDSKLISDVHWQGALKRKGTKQTSLKKGVG